MNDLQHGSFGEMMENSQLENSAHVYKSKSENSTRLRSIISDSVVSTAVLSKKARSRNRKKNKKLAEMRIPHLRSGATFTWDGKETVYFDGGGTGLHEQLAEGATVLDPTDMRCVIDSAIGARLESVFCLLPCNESKDIFQPATYKALAQLEKKTKSTTHARGIKREPKGTPKYVTAGTKACRNARGLIDGMTILKTLPQAHEEISRMLLSMEIQSAKYIPTLDLKALAESKRLGQYPGFLLENQKIGESTIWPSVAFGRNVFLPLHTDQDYFLSATVVYSNRSTRGAILAYFCFPTKGISVAMCAMEIFSYSIPQFLTAYPHPANRPCRPFVFLPTLSLSLCLGTVTFPQKWVSCL